MRVATNDTGAVSAQAGLYWFDERSQSSYVFRDLVPIGLTPYYAFPTDPVLAKSRAVFGQLTYRVTPRLRATAAWTRSSGESPAASIRSSTWWARRCASIVRPASYRTPRARSSATLSSAR